MDRFEKEVLVFSKQFGRHSYGPSHPLKVERLQLTMDLIAAYGLFDNPDAPWVEALKAEEKDLLQFHSAEYLATLKLANTGQTPPAVCEILTESSADYALGPGQTPIAALQIGG